MSTNRFPDYAELISNLTDSAFQDPANIDPRLTLTQDGPLAVHYAPFDHVEHDARLVLVGLTPGHQQMSLALATTRDALRAGATYAEAAATAKRAASFAGSMRTKLSEMLDRIGLQNVLGVSSCTEIWDRPGAVHYTSALRYPVLVQGRNYTGTPKPIVTPTLRRFIERELVEEAHMLSGAIWVPLGTSATDALLHLVNRSELARERVLDGLPHPSGANAERVAYFNGRKFRAALSSKTRPDKLDAARRDLKHRVAQLQA